MLARKLLILLLSALAALAGAQSYPPAWSTSDSYAIGDQVQLNGNVLRATHAVAPGGFKYDDWELWEVRANTVLLIGVGQSFTSLQTAWAYVENARVVEGAYLHLYISTTHGNFSDTFSAQLNVDHGSGASISLIGDNKNNITLSFPSSNGISIDSGHAFGTISGIKISGSSASQGIILTYNSTIAGISSMEMTGFGGGVYEFQGGAIYIGSGVTIDNCKNGLTADVNSTIASSPITFSDIPGGAGDCLHANHNSTIAISGNLGPGGWGTGAMAENGGLIDMTTVTVSLCNVGLIAVNKGHIDFQNGDLNANIAYDAEVSYAGTINALGATFTGFTSVGSNDGSYIYR